MRKIYCYNRKTIKRNRDGQNSGVTFQGENGTVGNIGFRFNEGNNSVEQSNVNKRVKILDRIIYEPKNIPAWQLYFCKILCQADFQAEFVFALFLMDNTISFAIVFSLKTNLYHIETVFLYFATFFMDDKSFCHERLLPFYQRFEFCLWL